MRGAGGGWKAMVGQQEAAHVGFCRNMTPSPGSLHSETSQDSQSERPEVRDQGGGCVRLSPLSRVAGHYVLPVSS